jgi:hypothetical protein
MVFKPTFSAHVHPFRLVAAFLVAAFLSFNVFAQDPVEDPAGSEGSPKAPVAKDTAAENSRESLQEVPFAVRPLTIQQEVDLSKGSRAYLSRALSRAARRLLVRANPELVHVRLAFDLARLATEVDKDSVECWRLFLAIAGASDPGDPEVQQAELEALVQISRLAPDDNVIRLRRLLLAIEQAQTVEERLARFEQLLRPESIALIGEDVAARLALDMALLYSRTGDTDAFSRRLAQAVELDPSFPSATAMAAGHFGQGDPVAESELLVAALLADPTEVGFASQLGTLALNYGAYASAERMLQIAQFITRSSSQYSSELALQRALALWGTGRDKEALGVITSHLRDLDSIEREKVRRENPDLDSSEILQITAAEPSQLSLLKAVILSESDDSQAYREYVAKVLKKLMAVIEQPASSDSDEQTKASFEQATLLLEAAAFAAWQGEDSEMVDRFVSAARKRIDLTPEALGRFEAWSAIARGRSELAIEILAHMEEDDELAALALSIAYSRTDQISSAARIWLRLARDVPGTVIGIWSRNRLQESLGSVLSHSEIAGKIKDQIVQIPTSFDRLLLQRDAAYSLRFDPVLATVEPFEPVIYTLEISNRSGIKISIGNDGPLLPTAALTCSTTAAGGGGTSQSNLLVLPIDRQLAIDPHNSMTIDIDLDFYPVGEISIARAGEGFSIAARAVSNFTSDGQMVVPGLFGEKATARLLRIDGITPDKPYRRDTLEQVSRMENVAALNGLLLLLQVALRSEGVEVSAAAEGFRDKILQIFILQYQQLPSAARAWLAYAAPGSSSVPGYDKIVSLFMSDRDQLVESTLLAKLSWSAREGGSRNTYLVRLLDSENPEIAAMARDMQEIWDISEMEENAAISSQ